MSFNTSALSIRPSLPFLIATMLSIVSFDDDLPFIIFNVQ